MFPRAPRESSAEEPGGLCLPARFLSQNGGVILEGKTACGWGAFSITRQIEWRVAENAPYLVGFLFSKASPPWRYLRSVAKLVRTWTITGAAARSVIALR